MHNPAHVAQAQSPTEIHRDLRGVAADRQHGDLPGDRPDPVAFDFNSEVVEFAAAGGAMFSRMLSAGIGYDNVRAWNHAFMKLVVAMGTAL